MQLMAMTKWEANITCYRCGQKGYYRKDCPSSTGTSPVPDQTPMYSPPTIVKQLGTASYVVSQSNSVIILKELPKSKQMNWKLRKSMQQIPPKQNHPTQPKVTKPTMSSKEVTAKTSAIGKNYVWFAPETTPSNSIKTVTPVWKTTPTIATIDVQDDEVVLIETENGEVTSTEDEIGNPSEIPPLRKNWVLNDYSQTYKLCRRTLFFTRTC